MSVPQAKQMRRAYGFDEIAIVPGDATINPAMTETTFRIDQFEFPVPILAASMDAVVDPGFAISFAEAGGLAVLNLEGVQTRYERPESVLEEIASASQEQADELTHMCRFEVLTLVAAGEPNKEIAGNLYQRGHRQDTPRSHLRETWCGRSNRCSYHCP